LAKKLYDGLRERRSYSLFFLLLERGGGLLRLDEIRRDFQRHLISLERVDAISPVHQAQLLTYLMLSHKHLGLLINFNVVHLRDGIRRMVNGDPPSAVSSESSVSSVIRPVSSVSSVSSVVKSEVSTAKQAF